MRPFVVLVFFLSMGGPLRTQVFTNAGPAELHWKTFKGGIFVEADPAQSRTLHLPLDLSGSKGLKLKIESPRGFYLFINGKLVSKTKFFVELSTDSLVKIYSNVLMLSLYSPNGFTHLKNKWVLPEPATFNPRREPAGFQTFI